jgi:CubicO group peptidase (beta-lactamase class C family)
VVTIYSNPGFRNIHPNPQLVMNKILCLLLLFTILEQRAALGQDKDLGVKVEQYLRPYVETGNFSGQVLISRNGKVLFSKAFGLADQEFNVPNDLNTVFHMASVSKTFTAAAILLLEQRGLLTTEDPVSKFIPDYPLGNKITLHHLLSHTSGITEVNDLPEYVEASLQQQTPETLVALFKNKPLEFLPGEKYQYSNSNYGLLGFIIEQVSKKKFGDFLRENIFTPLEMDQTFHHESMVTLHRKMVEGYASDGNFGLQKSRYLDWSSKTGSGSLVSTANDLGKWGKALFGTTVLNDKSKNKMFTEYVDSGYGWYLGKQFDKKYIFMNGRGGGFCTHIGLYVEEKVCVIVLSNIYVFVPKQIAIDLAGILFQQPIEAPALSRKLNDEESRQLIGKYKFGKDFYRPDFVIEVSANNGSLFSNYGELLPNGSLQFFQRSYWSKVSFTKNASGKVDGMTFDSYRGEKVE